MDHPSVLALDLAALGGQVPAEVARHLEACQACAATVAERRAAGPLPGWVHGVRVAPALVQPPSLAAQLLARLRRPAWRLLPLPAAAALVAAVVLLLPAPQPEPGGGAVREKALPAVAVYLKRGATVAAWDGRSPVQPGDRIQLGIRGAGFTHLSVASLQAGAGPALLYAGPLEPRGETLLPVSFRVDAGGDREELSIILAIQPVAPDAHGPPSGEAASRGAWAARLLLPKEPTR